MQAQPDHAPRPGRLGLRRYERRFALIVAAAALPFATALAVVLLAVPDAPAALARHWVWCFAAALAGVAGVAWVRLMLLSRLREFQSETHRIAGIGSPGGIDPAALIADLRESVTTVEHERGETASLLKQLRLTLDTMPFACVVVDAQSRVTGWNAAAERLFGWPKDAVLGREPFDLLAPPATRAAARATHARLLAGAEPERAIARTLRNDGAGVTCEWYVQRLPVAEGEPASLIAFAVDLTGHRRAERALAESEARFRQLLQLTSDWYWEQDKSFRFVATGSGSHAASGPLGDCTGFTLWERERVRPVGFTWEAHRGVLDAHQPFSDLVIEVAGDGGGRTYVSLRGEPLLDASGVLRGYRGTATDITARHCAEVLRAGERRVFGMLAAGAPLDGLMSELCEAVGQALRREAYVGLLLLDGGRLMPLADRGVPAPLRQATAAGIEPGEFNGACGAAAALNRVVVCADVATDARWEKYRQSARDAGVASCWSTPVRGADGALLATFAVYCPLPGAPTAEDLDLTASAASLSGVLIERFRADERLRESDARYRSLVELSEDGVALHDERGIRYANPALARILGAADAASLEGVDLYELLEPESKSLAARRRRRVMESAQTAPYAEFRLRRLDGEVIDIEAAGNPVEVHGQRMVQTYVRDISRRKWVERELQRVNESLEQRVAERTRELTNVNRELESFSYTVAHDLRAPLRAIDGYAKMIVSDAGSEIPEGMRRDLDRIAGAAQHMAELIDGLLEFSRLSRGTASYRRVPMRALVDSVVSEARAAYTHAVDVVVEDLPDVFGDPDMIRQVWVNLIFNAFKFTSRATMPQVRITCKPEADEVVFSVADNGAGFDSSYAGKLFGMFQRLHSRSEFEGTGVGLAIVRRVIERHFGRVWAEGATGQGATFRFALPATSCVLEPGFAVSNQ